VVAPNKHYQRIETYDERQDTMYYLTRLEGQLLRLNELVKNAQVPKEQILHTIDTARAFAQSLRNSLDPNKIDVA